MNEFLKTEIEIKSWLDLMRIKNYKIKPETRYGHVVDVGGNVYLCEKNLTHIPVKFDTIEGVFDCSTNRLKTLDFSPTHVSGYFDCSFNQLTSLLHSPKIVGGAFACAHNRLTDLQFGPERVGEFFDCSNNKIISLEYLPQFIGSNYFFCNYNSPLDSVQEITDPKEIRQIHEQYLGIKNEQKLLNNLIQKTKTIQDRSYKI